MEENNEILDQSTKSIDSQTGPKEKLPNHGGILTMGILSIVFAGGIGIILGIIALSLSGKPLRDYKSDPDRYDEASFKNVKAGKVCSIVGISIAGVVILVLFGLIVSGEF